MGELMNRKVQTSEFSKNSEVEVYTLWSWRISWARSLMTWILCRPSLKIQSGINYSYVPHYFAGRR